MRDSFLQAFLVFDIFLAGAVTAIALRHAYAHFRPNAHGHDDHPQPGGHLPPAVRQKLLEEAQANFESVVRAAARDLQKDLQSTADEIKQQVEIMGKEAKTKELDHYKAVINELQEQTKSDVEGVDKEMAEQKTELKAKLATEIAAEKQRLLEQIDTKLADAVTSFLTETLQHDVDLGSQSAYLMKTLEEHKADFAKEVAGDEA
jgi:uncharacterized protein YaaR (DUF327 family)